MTPDKRVEEVVCKDIKNYNHATTVYEDMVKLLTQDRLAIATELVEALEERINYLTQDHLGKSAVEMGGFTNSHYQNHGQVMSFREAQNIIKSTLLESKN